MKTAGSISELPDILDLLGKQSSSGPSKADKLLGGGIGEHFCTVLATKLNELDSWKSKQYPETDSCFHYNNCSSLYYISTFLSC
jgi:hypothetical protein